MAAYGPFRVCPIFPRPPGAFSIKWTTLREVLWATCTGGLPLVVVRRETQYDRPVQGFGASEKLTWREAVEAVLRDAADPMHYTDIAEEIAARKLRGDELGATP